MSEPLRDTAIKGMAWEFVNDLEQSEIPKGESIEVTGPEELNPVQSGQSDHLQVSVKYGGKEHFIAILKRGLGLPSRDEAGRYDMMKEAVEAVVSWANGLGYMISFNKLPLEKNYHQRMQHLAEAGLSHLNRRNPKDDVPWAMF